MNEQQRSRAPRRRQRLGIVTSDRMQKTIVVRVERSVRHPEYGRVVRQTVSFKAHDERNEARIGDQVLVAETRPLSKDKRWRLVKIVRRGVVSVEVADQVETGVTA